MGRRRVHAANDSYGKTARIQAADSGKSLMKSRDATPIRAGCTQRGGIDSVVAVVDGAVALGQSCDEADKTLSVLCALVRCAFARGTRSPKPRGARPTAGLQAIDLEDLRLRVASRRFVFRPAIEDLERRPDESS